MSGIKVYDPMVRDYRGRELEPGIAKEIVENDKLDIKGCDALLVMYEKPSVGTSMEVLFAHQLGKLIVLVDRSGKPLSPWLIYHVTQVCPTLEAGCEALRGRCETAYLCGPINGCTDDEAKGWREVAKELLT